MGANLEREKGNMRCSERRCKSETTEETTTTIPIKSAAPQNS